MKQANAFAMLSMITLCVIAAFREV